MPPIGWVVFDADGNAGIHCGTDADGAELVAWLGKPSVVTHEVDEKGDGVSAYSTQLPVADPNAEKPRSENAWRR